jgi:hypothetical protein
MSKILFLSVLFLISGMDMCKNVQIDASGDILGDYQFKGYFLGDAIDQPCGWQTPLKTEITLAIKKNEKAEIGLSGRSTVNQYFAGLQLADKPDARGVYAAEVSTMGSTKMAGPPEMMECELRFFNMLRESKEIRIQENFLHIGTFKKDNTPSRDGGTYMIFERI